MAGESLQIPMKNPQLEDSRADAVEQVGLRVYSPKVFVLATAGKSSVV